MTALRATEIVLVDLRRRPAELKLVVPGAVPRGRGLLRLIRDPRLRGGAAGRAGRGGAMRRLRSRARRRLAHGLREHAEDRRRAARSPPGRGAALAQARRRGRRGGGARRLPRRARATPPRPRRRARRSGLDFDRLHRRPRLDRDAQLAADHQRRSPAPGLADSGASELVAPSRVRRRPAGDAVIGRAHLRDARRLDGERPGSWAPRRWRSVLDAIDRADDPLDRAAVVGAFFETGRARLAARAGFEIDELGGPEPV